MRGQRALLSRPLFEDLDVAVVSGLVIDGNGANG
tara:strand:+ start:456 stop:557 length:102 start_codon:yes stop_codon:yes gene_type:complete